MGTFYEESPKSSKRSSGSEHSPRSVCEGLGFILAVRSEAKVPRGRVPWAGLQAAKKTSPKGEEETATRMTDWGCKQEFPSFISVAKSNPGKKGLCDYIPGHSPSLRKSRAGT